MIDSGKLIKWVWFHKHNRCVKWVCLILFLVAENECSICKDAYNIEENGRELPCKHLFHDICITQWLKLVRKKTNHTTSQHTVC